MKTDSFAPGPGTLRMAGFVLLAILAREPFALATLAFANFWRSL